MKLTFYLSIILLCNTQSLFAQSDTLNLYNTNGEKKGWWVIYLDHNLEQVDDSTKATHCRYTYYTGKFDHYNMGAIGTKKTPVIFPKNDTLTFGGLTMLNGTYSSNYKGGKIHFELSADAGILKEYKEYYKNGQLKTHLIYSEKCGAPIRGCIKLYDENGKLTYDGTNRIPGD
ncbi:hypothetical protein K6119_09655 [Paracrocinitomix mangrovi]|uniref:hypothetical protein n=1 Tax=Paracrocinitomix mangrovi TaxID=2862509 RepID=UPI001C8D9918|nr:hypothetical protein [Paracrocinitomix mangrovi]UKN03756.1 hypothetical protein K6119_09655 [Paracrocinitomix mangrovi]